MESNFLIGLDQLQETDQDHVGPQILRLNQLLNAGYPVQNGWIISDAIMRQVWSQIEWSNEILQDFPYLNLNFSLSQAAQARFMAQMVQRGIEQVSGNFPWKDLLEKSLRQLSSLGEWDKPGLVFTPYVWTDSDQLESDTPLTTRLVVKALTGTNQPEVVWQSLKALWASLFQAQNLYVLQHLGLQPEQVHLSILIQPIHTVQVSGWVQLTAHQILIQALPGFTQTPWQAETELEYFVYDRNTLSQRLLQPSMEPPSGFLAPDLCQSLLRLVQQMEEDFDLRDSTFTWGAIAPQSANDCSLNIWGLAADLPLPMPVAAFSRSPDGDPPQKQFNRSPAQPLGAGVSASPGRLSAPVTVVTNFQDIPPERLQGSILAISHLDPIHLPWLKFAAGLICTTGGVTSHGAIMARELGIPAIMNVPEIMTTLKTGEWIVLDGDRGEVWPVLPSTGPPEALIDHDLNLNRFEETAQTESAQTEYVQTKPTQTKTKVLVNLSQPSLLHRTLGLEVDGIGLVRGEWLFLDQWAHRTIPWDWNDTREFQSQMYKTLSQMVQSLAPRPFYYRAIDLYNFAELFSDHSTAKHPAQNPALGVRGTLRTLQDGRLFALELAVLKDLLRDGVNNLRLVLPFVRSPQEVTCCLDMMQAGGIVPGVDLPLWLMAEVPSMLFALDQYGKLGIQGIAIGLNDLAQLLCGIDRDHPAFETTVRQNESVLQDVVVQFIQRAQALNLGSLLYGYTPSAHPEAWLEPLIQAGLTGVSVDLDAVRETRLAIAQIEQQLDIHQNSDDPIVEIS